MLHSFLICPGSITRDDTAPRSIVTILFSALTRIATQHIFAA